MRKVSMVTDRELEILKILWARGKASVREVQDDLNKGAYRLNLMIAYVALSLPAHAYVLLPAAGLIGTLFALARMSENSELTVMRAAGLSLRQLALFVCVAALVVALPAGVGQPVALPAAEEFRGPGPIELGQAPALVVHPFQVRG